MTDRDLLESRVAELDTLSYMVRTGKPAAMMPVPVRCLEAARRRVRRLHGLETYEQIICNGWASLWIYQYPHIREVIESLPDAPQTVYDHWVLGKLFGYSEEAICSFIGDLGPGYARKI